MAEPQPMASAAQASLGTQWQEEEALATAENWDAKENSKKIKLPAKTPFAS